MNPKVKRLLTDLVRVLVLLVLTGYLLYAFDPSNIVIFQAAGIMVFLVGSTHVTRRILFPALDLQAIAKEAIEDRNAQALGVFAIYLVFLMFIIAVPLLILRP